MFNFLYFRLWEVGNRFCCLVRGRCISRWVDLPLDGILFNIQAKRGSENIKYKWPPLYLLNTYSCHAHITMKHYKSPAVQDQITSGYCVRSIIPVYLENSLLSSISSMCLESSLSFRLFLSTFCSWLTIQIFLVTF